MSDAEVQAQAQALAALLNINEGGAAKPAAAGGAAAEPAAAGGADGALAAAAGKPASALTQEELFRLMQGRRAAKQGNER